MKFKPGQSGNPNGRPKVDPVIRKLRRLSQDDFQILVYKYMFTKIEDLKLLLQDDTLEGIDKWIVTIIYKGMLTGDVTRLSALLDRIIGRVKTVVEVSGLNGGPIQTSEESEEERIDRRNRIAELIAKHQKLDGK